MKKKHPVQCTLCVKSSIVCKIAHPVKTHTLRAKFIHGMLFCTHFMKITLIKVHKLFSHSIKKMLHLTEKIYTVCDKYEVWQGRSLGENMKELLENVD